VQVPDFFSNKIKVNKKNRLKNACRKFEQNGQNSTKKQEIRENSRNL